MIPSQICFLYVFSILWWLYQLTMLLALAPQAQYRLGEGAEGWLALYIRNELVCFSHFCYDM